ncbi:DUF559 domain-containing protein [Gordonibacter sp. 28C]|uniref:endonuclease domain-containing protein n=1 Tax=Gordonibacter sp. 28C TaxID=2078569 RepID=UPI000DF808F2|nr:DUF559 domain-containing protein [Gordonibacter sp. 28C]RDB61538.1 DUF559 domain-containing protein [Gordonibacter sp. 28C]
MHPIPLCFGHITALQILRTTNTSERSLLRSGPRTLPSEAPNAKTFCRSIELLRASHPTMVIEQPAHILVSRTSQCRSSSAFTAHACSAELQGCSLLRLQDGVYTSSAALAFTHLAAQEKSAIALLELGYELCGTYQTRRTGVLSGYQVEPLASIRALEAFIARNPSLRGAAKAAKTLHYMTNGSASPRETKQALVLGLPLMYGGYGLGIPRMNYEVRASPAARALTGKSSFRCDLCWPEAKLDVEYQSRESHSGEEKRLEDSRRTNALAAMGWTVFCITNDELDSMVATDTIADTIRRHLGKRSQVRVSGYHARKLKLRRQLGLPVGYN